MSMSENTRHSPGCRTPRSASTATRNAAFAVASTAPNIVNCTGRRTITSCAVYTWHQGC
jgi:hypothetical protein